MGQKDGDFCFDQRKSQWYNKFGVKKSHIPWKSVFIAHPVYVFYLNRLFLLAILDNSLYFQLLVLYKLLC